MLPENVEKHARKSQKKITQLRREWVPQANNITTSRPRKLFSDLWFDEPLDTNEFRDYCHSLSVLLEVRCSN